MRKLNTILSVLLLFICLLHGLMGSFMLLGISSGAGKFLAWIGVGILAAHTVLGLLLTAQTFRASRSGGKLYGKQNALFWARRTSGLAILLMLFFHIGVFGRVQDGVYILFPFTTVRLLTQLLLVASVFVHLLLNLRPLLVSLGIVRDKEQRGDLYLILSILVLFAALTSSIALTESAVSTFEDEIGWSRRKSTAVIGIIMIALGTLSCLGYGPLAFVKIIGMQFLDFFDFLTNSVMMPIAAMMTSIFVSKVVGIDRIEEEIRHGEAAFRRKKIFVVMIKYLCPIFAMIILASSVANAFGWISM